MSESTRRCAVDEADGSWFVVEFRAAEHEKRAADEEAKRDDLDTKRRGAMSGDQHQDARHERDDEQHERLTGGLGALWTTRTTRC
jgi:hypothetical protein